MQKYSNPCIRCGKERIEARVWKEKVEDSIIINRQMICPDPLCQKKVDSDNKKIRDKHALMKTRSEERALKRKKSRVKT